MFKVTENWELCIACGNTYNKEGQEFCGDCGFKIEYEED